MEKENLLNEEEKTSINATAGGGGTYEDFNPNDPYNEANNFKPAFCLNFKTGEVWFGGGKAKINADGSGYLANKAITWNADNSGSLANGAITWSSNGEVQMNLGIRKKFKTININDYTSSAFILDLTQGYNFIFTKNTDNEDRTITLPTDLSLDGIDVELIFKGNPGYIYVTTNKSYGFRYNTASVEKVSLGIREIRLELSARKEKYNRYVEWWINNDSAFDLFEKQSASKYAYCENKYYN